MAAKGKNTRLKSNNDYRNFARPWRGSVGVVPVRKPAGFGLATVHKPAGSCRRV
jgi:hypothetical protein